MNALKNDFNKRAKETKRYFLFVIRIAGDDIQLVEKQNRSCALTEDVNGELTKTLKAMCHLLLYNLVESTMRNIIQTIFDEFRNCGVRFDDCRDEIKKIILTNFRKREPESLLQRLQDFAKDVVTETFISQDAFSGNLDAKTIRDTAERYGFGPLPTHRAWTLHEVKNNRNYLAHGNKSFSEVGQDLTIEKLREARKQTVVLLWLTIRRVHHYLLDKKYLASNATYPCLTT